MRALGRMIMVPLALIVASVTVAAVLLTLGLERATQALAGGSGDLDWWVGMFDFVRGLTGFAAALSIAPAVLLAIIGEVARIRSATYYIFGGGAALALLPLLSQGNDGKELFQFGAVWQVFATAGFAGGLAYWLIAGRRA